MALYYESPKKLVQEIRCHRKGVVTRRSCRAIIKGLISQHRLAGATANRGLPIAMAGTVCPGQQREAGHREQRWAASVTS